MVESPPHIPAAKPQKKGRPVRPVVWSLLKLHGDCHARPRQVLLLGPLRLVHPELRARVTEITVSLFCDLELAQPPTPTYRQLGSRATADEHLPQEAVAYKLQDPRWCLRQTGAVGPGCRYLIETLVG